MKVIQMISQLLHARIGAELAQMTFESKLCLLSASDVRLSDNFRWKENFLLDYVYDCK